MKLRLMALLLMLLALAACQRRPQSTAELPRHLGAAARVAVAPFSQPTQPGELITGQIPRQQGRISQDDLLLLDRDLREALVSATSRHYMFIPRRHAAQDPNSARSTVQPSALPRWVAYGREHGVDYLLVPQVLDWHEREGSGAGVTEAAHVRLEFFLINLESGEPVQRSIFEEKQVGLTENLLSVPSFIRRKGVWITAPQLADDGIRKAVGELGL